MKTIEFITNRGNFTVELNDEQAPVSAENFATYAREGFFDGLIFHRVIPGFMVQGGGFLPGMQRREPHAPIKNEANNGLQNLRGTLAMARTSDPHSASSQFFVNLVDNVFLDHQRPTGDGWGYCVFGKVTAGMEVIDDIATVRTGQSGGHGDVPVHDVVIESATLTEEA